MKKSLSRSQAQSKIDSFFQKESFSAEEVKKIKRLAMKYKIKLGPHRKSFCKKCLSQLKGKLRISKTHKTIICESCSTKNRIKI